MKRNIVAAVLAALCIPVFSMHGMGPDGLRRRITAPLRAVRNAIPGLRQSAEDNNCPVCWQKLDATTGIIIIKNCRCEKIDEHGNKVHVDRKICAACMFKTVMQAGGDLKCLMCNKLVGPRDVDAEVQPTYREIVAFKYYLPLMQECGDSDQKFCTMFCALHIVPFWYYWSTMSALLGRDWVEASYSFAVGTVLGPALWLMLMDIFVLSHVRCEVAIGRALVFNKLDGPLPMANTDAGAARMFAIVAKLAYQRHRADNAQQE